MTKALYAGSFDPLTKGHLWMIQQGSIQFSELHVAVGTHPKKQYTFPLDDRVAVLKKAAKDFSNVSIGVFDKEYLVRYAESIGADLLFRGLRNPSDYEAERVMRYVNSDLNPRIQTIFMMPPRELIEISSSFVKNLGGYNGWERAIEGYVPRYVYQQMLLKFQGFKKRWMDLCQRIGFHGEEEYPELMKKYGEEHRTHHNLVHIAHMLHEFDGIRQLLKAPDQVEMAIWWHDAEYDPKKDDNEATSARMAGQRLKEKGVQPGFIDGVVRKILFTQHTDVPNDADTCFLVDLDLAILGAKREIFERYNHDIREEYSNVADPDYKKERKEVLKGFLRREAIYLTSNFAKYEKQARRNLRRAIRALGTKD